MFYLLLYYYSTFILLLFVFIFFCLYLHFKLLSTHSLNPFPWVLYLRFFSFLTFITTFYCDSYSSLHCALNAVSMHFASWCKILSNWLLKGATQIIWTESHWTCLCCSLYGDGHASFFIQIYVKSSVKLKFAYYISTSMSIIMMIIIIINSHITVSKCDFLTTFLSLWEVNTLIHHCWQVDW